MTAEIWTHFLTIEDIARELHFSPKYVRERLNEGHWREMKARKIGAKWLVRVEDFNKWWEARK
ncbi:MAG TPA: hypothetical protein DCY07_04280 [Rhodospirillaceae bacterium]|nr:hypothetical protein [Rhodospirillaceae bacterium]